MTSPAWVPPASLTGANFAGAQALSIMTRNPTPGNWGTRYSTT